MRFCATITSGLRIRSNDARSPSTIPHKKMDRRILLFGEISFGLPLLVLFALAALASGCTSAQAQQTRLQVVPVLFVPSDNSENYEGGKFSEVRKLIRQHLVMAQAHYRTLLVTDTFEIANGDALVYASRHPHSYYDDHFSKVKPDNAHLIVQELFARFGEDRYNSRTVYLVIYARPPSHPFRGGPNFFG